MHLAARPAGGTYNCPRLPSWIKKDKKGEDGKGGNWEVEKEMSGRKVEIWTSHCEIVGTGSWCSDS